MAIYTEYHFQEETDIESTLFCGQTFLWKRTGDGYIGCIEGKPARAWRTEGGFALRCCAELDAAHWHRYFDLDRDYAAIAARYCADENVRRACVRFLGLRVLNQPVWETLACFIISANNNIKRIYGIVDALSKALGARAEFDGELLYAFPSASRIADAGEDALRALGLGYRAPYLVETARRVANGYDLPALASLGYEAALRELQGLKGVGEKVADCVLLFSCGYAEAFPVDTWVKKLMRSLYGVEGSAKLVKEKAAALFGADRGIVQQMLFHGARMGLYPDVI